MEGGIMNDVIRPQAPDCWHLYRQMLRCRLFEKEVMHLWQRGLISGEMHMSMGEEAIAAGIVDQLVDGDAMALDHRGTAPMLVRGVDPVLLLKEFLGKSDGLCNGMGGHMHLFSQEHLVISDGIVGGTGPAALGFAMANQRLRPGKISVAFFGEGAVNEGMLLESFNLASAWKLPVMFVCKDNDQSIWTQSSGVTGGNLLDRAKSFGLRTCKLNGSDVEEVWNIANEEISHLRNGEGPVFLHISTAHLEGHFLGDALLRLVRSSLRFTLKIIAPVFNGLLTPTGGSIRERFASLQELLKIIGITDRKYRTQEGDPIPPLRKKLSSIDDKKLIILEAQLLKEIEIIVEQAAQAPTDVGGKGS